MLSLHLPGETKGGWKELLGSQCPEIRTSGFHNTKQGYGQHHCGIPYLDGALAPLEIKSTITCSLLTETSESYCNFNDKFTNRINIFRILLPKTRESEMNYEPNIGALLAPTLLEADVYTPVTKRHCIQKSLVNRRAHIPEKHFSWYARALWKIRSYEDSDCC